jgi:hypothetical protein
MKTTNTPTPVLPPAVSSPPSPTVAKPVQKSNKPPTSTPETETAVKKSTEISASKASENLDWKNTLKKFDLQQEATLEGIYLLKIFK